MNNLENEHFSSSLNHRHPGRQASVITTRPRRPPNKQMALLDLFQQDFPCLVFPQN